MLLCWRLFYVLFYFSCIFNVILKHWHSHTHWKSTSSSAIAIRSKDACTAALFEIKLLIKKQRSLFDFYAFRLLKRQRLSLSVKGSHSGHKLFDKHMKHNTNLVDHLSSVKLVFFLLKDLRLPLFLFNNEQILSSFSNFLSLKIIVFIMSMMYMTVLRFSRSLLATGSIIFLVWAIKGIKEEWWYLSINRSHQNSTFFCLVFSNFDNFLNGGGAMSALITEIWNIIFVYWEGSLSQRLWGYRR